MTTLTTMRTSVRRDLKDEDSSNYRWTDNEIDRAIEKAVLMYSEFVPLVQLTSTLHTVDLDNTVDISTLTDRLDVVKVEHPIDIQPYPARRFTVWGDLITFLDGYVGDGAHCNIYWFKKHTLSTTSTINTAHDHIIAIGAVAYAVSSQAQYQVNLANTGGQKVNKDYNFWARAMFEQFYEQLQMVKTYNFKKLKQSTLSEEE